MFEGYVDECLCICDLDGVIIIVTFISVLMGLGIIIGSSIQSRIDLAAIESVSMNIAPESPLSQEEKKKQ